MPEYSYTYHENEQDRVAEETAVKRYALERGLKFIKLPRYGVVDYALTDNSGKIAHFLEYKRRSIPVGKYTDIMISETKVRIARAKYELGVKTFFLVEWDDARGVMRITKPDYMKVAESNRGDPNDVESICFYNIKENMRMLDQ